MIDLIKYQVLTEKANKVLSRNIYTFDVCKSLDKSTIKLLFKEIFNVEVISIKSYILPSRRKRLGKYKSYKGSLKRVLLKLKEGDSIPFFSGL